MSAIPSPDRPLARRSVLVGALAAPGIASLAACSGDTGGSATPEVPQVEYEQGSSSLKVELGPEIEGVPYPEGYVGPRAREIEPFGDGSTEFRVLTRSGAGLDFETNLHSLYLEEKTGVRIAYETVPQGEEGAPKVNAILSGGDLPDGLMLGPEWMGGFTKSQIYAYGAQGLFQPLDQLIDEYAPQLQELFEQNPDLRASWTAPDGAMYAIPSVNQCYHCASSDTRTWVHQPTMEAAGWTEQPTTLEEFEQMLRDMLAADPDLRPFSGDKAVLPFGLIGASVYDMGINKLRRDGDAIVYTPVEDGFREVLTVVARLVKDGLLDPNAFTQDNDQLKRLTMDPDGSRVGVLQMGNQYGIVDVEWTGPDALVHQFVPLAPFSGSGGDPIIPWNESHGDASGLVITSACEDPVTLVRWADAQLGLLPTLEMRLGAIDRHWEWGSDDQLGIDGRPALYARFPVEGEEEDNITWPESGVYNLGMDVRHGESVDENTSVEPVLYQAGKLFEPYRAPIESLFIPPFFSAEDSAEIGELRANIDSLYAQGTAKMALGDLDPTSDEDWESFVASFESANLPRYLEILTEADRRRP
ncbi:extracellular solute-binding protein [Brachybacterium sp. YJGR34]|uniref:extracellular solute-binding protein n=1 Tax=Brachybacterium sp. YJGR34 TaxID=2059911 RepID=UPI000E0BE35D|nr:extracellular solute-binding protein [Brachybacterium sp. YJGR34]